MRNSYIEKMSFLSSPRPTDRVHQNPCSDEPLFITTELERIGLQATRTRRLARRILGEPSFCSRLSPYDDADRQPHPTLQATDT